MGKYFGTDGFRGEAGKDLTVEHAFKIGRYLGNYYSKDHRAKIVIGKESVIQIIAYGVIAGSRQDKGIAGKRLVVLKLCL